MSGLSSSPQDSLPVSAFSRVPVAPARTYAYPSIRDPTPTFSEVRASAGLIKPDQRFALIDILRTINVNMRVRGVGAGHGQSSNGAGRLWLMSTSSTEEEVGDLFGSRCPLPVVPMPAEHDILVSTRPRPCTPSPLSCGDVP